MKSWLVYTIGRVSSVASRPLYLYIANNHLNPGTTEHIAVVFLVAALAIVGIAADPHRRYLLRREEMPVTQRGVTFYLYAASLWLMLLVGSAFVLAACWHFTGSLALGGVAIAYFISERVADEVQRLRIFARQLDLWARFAIYRSLLQIGGLAILLLLFGERTLAIGAIAAFTIANLALFVPQLPATFLRALITIRLTTALWLTRRAARLLFSGWRVWFAAQLTACFGFLDRAAALLLDKAVLPLFMLVVMCFSILQFVIDSYYLSRYRRDFLERTISLPAAFSNRSFLASFSGGLVLGVLACVTVLSTSRGGNTFPLQYVFVIALLQVASALSIIPREILYWGDELRKIIRIELAFWTIFAVAMSVGWAADFGLNQLFLIVVLCSGARLLHYLLAARRIVPRGLAIGSDAAPK